MTIDPDDLLFTGVLGSDESMPGFLVPALTPEEEEEQRGKANKLGGWVNAALAIAYEQQEYRASFSAQAIQRIKKEAVEASILSRMEQIDAAIRLRENAARAIILAEL